MNVPRYITGITAQDLAKIYAVANVKVGDGIKITKDGDTLKIALDENLFKQWVHNFAVNGGLTCADSDVNGIPLTKIS